MRACVQGADYRAELARLLPPRWVWRKKHAKPLRASLMMFLVSVATSGPVPSPGATGSDGGMPCTHACSKYTANQVCVCPVDLHCVLGDQA